RLRAEVARWKQAGLPILAEDFETPAVADDQNAAVALNLAAVVSVENDEWFNLEGVFEKIPFSADERRMADVTLEENAKSLGRVRRARNLTLVCWERVRVED